MKLTIGKAPGPEAFAVPPGLEEIEEPEIEYRWRVTVYTSERTDYNFYFYTEEEVEALLERVKTEIYDREPLIEIVNTIFIINNISTIITRKQSRWGPKDYWESA